ncbi:MAG: Flp family type IVb pilin [Planctomycetia bacterium]
MNRFKKIMRTLLADQEGAALVEYGLLVGLIAVICVGVITTIGTSVQTAFTTIDTALP